jgi:hypothetical protein
MTMIGVVGRSPAATPEMAPLPRVVGAVHLARSGGRCARTNNGPGCLFEDPRQVRPTPRSVSDPAGALH